MFTEKQLKDLLKAQSDLNNAYVNNWIKEVPLSKWLCAFQCEWAEFLESTPRFYGHKWWKPTLEDDIQNSKVEIVDMLHFGLSKEGKIIIFLNILKRDYHDKTYNTKAGWILYACRICSPLGLLFNMAGAAGVMAASGSSGKSNVCHGGKSHCRE